MNWNVFSDRKWYRVPMTVLVILVTSFVLLNLPYDCVQRRVWTGQVIDSKAHRQLDVIRKNIAVPISLQGWENDHLVGRFAGWPEAIRLPSASVGTARELWTALMHNAYPLLLCVFLIPATLLVTQRFLLRLFWALRPSFGWRHAAVVSSVMFCFTGSTVGCHRIVVSDVSLQQAVAANGALGFSTRLPALLANLLPASISQPFLSLDCVVATGLHPSLVDQLVDQPSLQRLLLRDCLINRSQLQQLVEHPTMEQVRFERCHFDAGSMVTVPMSWHVADLTIANCTGVENINSVLPHARSLKRCMIQGSAEMLQSSIEALHRGSLETLDLVISYDKTATGHSTNDVSVESPCHSIIKINAFPVLRSLTLFDRSHPDSSGRSFISVSDCSELNRIAVERSRFWDLILEDLPKLVQLVSHSDKPGTFHNGGGFLACIRSLSMSNLPSIRKLAILSSSIERLRVDGCPALQELVLRGQPEYSRCAPDTRIKSDSLESEYGTSLAHHYLDIFGGKAWTEQLRSIDLSYNSLGSVDVRALTQLKELKKLVLDFTGVQISQLTSESPNKDLQHLSLCRDELSSAELNSLLDCFPNLVSTRFNPAQLDELVLENRAELQTLGLGTELAAESVKVINCPKLCEMWRFTKPLKKLHIQDVPQLLSLTVDYPVPEGAVLKGLQGLEQIDLSGDFLSDQHLKEIALCHQLESLAFKAPNVSPAALRRIGSLRNLSVLVLPHTRLNDDTVRSWGKLPLFELDLSYTAVSERSLQGLLEPQDIRILSLRHTKVSEDGVQAFQNLPRLFCLDLAGVQLNAMSLATLLQTLRLDILDLSGTHLDKDMVEVLCSEVGDHVTTLILHDCDIANVDIQRIVDTHPGLIIETPSATVSASFPLATF